MENLNRKPLRILFVGLGSIGNRNLESLMRIKPDAKFAALKRKLGSGTLVPSLLNFTTIKEASHFNPDLVFICNPTAHHFKTFHALSKELKTKHYFIEKPLTHLSSELKSFETLLKNKKINFYYGCLMRLHPLSVRVKEIIADAQLGKPICYDLYCGSNLADWRPGTDYTRSYSAQKKLGGGVALDLIHEFDLATFWFGVVQKMSGVQKRISNLKINSNDYATATLTHGRKIAGTIRLNYFRAKPKREFEIIFEHGVLSGNFISQTLEIATALKTHTETYPFTRNELHDQQSLQIVSNLEKKLKSPWKIVEVSQLLNKVIRLKEEK